MDDEVKVIRVNRNNKYEDGSVVEFKYQDEIFKGMIKSGFVLSTNLETIFYNIRAPHHLKFYVDFDNDKSIEELDVIGLIDGEEAEEIKKQIGFEEDFEES